MRCRADSRSAYVAIKIESMREVVHKMDNKTEEERKFYSSRRWNKVSRDHRKHEPLCRMCSANGIVRQADMTDHIIPIREGGDKWNPANHQSLCNHCHAIKRAQERHNRVGERGENALRRGVGRGLKPCDGK